MKITQKQEALHTVVKSVGDLWQGLTAYLVTFKTEWNYGLSPGWTFAYSICFEFNWILDNMIQSLNFSWKVRTTNLDLHKSLD